MNELANMALDDLMCMMGKSHNGIKKAVAQLLVMQWEDIVSSGDMSASDMIESLDVQVNGGCQGWDCSDEELTDVYAGMLGYDYPDNMTDREYDEWQDIVIDAANIYLRRHRLMDKLIALTINNAVEAAHTIWCNGDEDGIHDELVNAIKRCDAGNGTDDDWQMLIDHTER